jgi:hypothetical protein
MNHNRPPQITRHLLFAGDLPKVARISYRPFSAEPGEVEHFGAHLLILPIAGVFARHDGPRRHTVATPGHAVFFAADRPCRISFLACIGDSCLSLQWSVAALMRACPEAFARETFDRSAFRPNRLLPPSALLARGVLYHRLVNGQADALDVKETGLELLRAMRAPGTPADDRRHRTDFTRRAQRIERVKEVIATYPARPWTL